ncbi:uncharacterized protein LOC144705336 [Wolffia australiana]
MGRMALDAWIGRAGLRRVLRRHAAPERVTASSSSSAEAGVLSLEVSRVYFRVAHLWNALTDAQIARLQNDVFRLAGVRKLVGGDEGFLSALALAETLDSLGAGSRAAALLSRRCSDAALRKLEQALPDAVAAAVAVGGGTALLSECDAEGLRGWALAGKKMEKEARKMELQAEATLQLFQEMEILLEMEESLRREQAKESSSASDGSLSQRVDWQRQRVSALREQSLWDKSYDDIVRLLARSLFTVALRVHAVFGGFETVAASELKAKAEESQPDGLHRSYSETARRAFSSPLQRDCRRAAAEQRHHHSGPLGAFWRKPGPAAVGERRFPAKPMTNWATWAVSRGPFWGGTRAEEAQGRWNERSAGSTVGPAWEEAAVAAARALLGGGDILGGGTAASLVASMGGNSVSNTLGACALALRFANIIVVIERLAECPRLIDRRDRDELYGMLPASVRAALRAKLKPCARALARRGHDPALAAEWRGAIARILDWLSPLAHNTVRWQSERRFEQQQWPARPSLLLLQTLQFADRAKTEAAVVELLVGLNYVWRSARETNGGPS